MDKEDVVYVHNIMLFKHTKERNFAFWSHVDGFGRIMLSEIRQTEKDKYCMFSIMCGI